MQNKVSHNDRHFTVLGLTALDGSPVFCVIIIAGVKQMYEVKTGLDKDAKIVGDTYDSDFFEKNRGKGKLYPIGPECIFRRRPCLDLLLGGLPLEPSLPRSCKMHSRPWTIMVYLIDLPAECPFFCWMVTGVCPNSHFSPTSPT